MRIFIEEDTVMQDVLSKRISPPVVNSAVSRIILDMFTLPPTQYEAMFFCELLLEYTYPVHSLWVYRQAYSSSTDYIVEAAGGLGQPSEANLAVCAAERDDNMVKCKHLEEKLRNASCTGVAYLIYHNQYIALASLLHKFWMCQGGRWIFLNGDTPIDVVFDCAVAADSTRGIQRVMRSSMPRAQLVATTYDDNIIEALLLDHQKSVMETARSTADRNDVDLLFELGKSHE